MDSLVYLSARSQALSQAADDVCSQRRARPQRNVALDQTFVLSVLQPARETLMDPQARNIESKFKLHVVRTTPYRKSSYTTELADQEKRCMYKGVSVRLPSSMHCC